MVHIPKIKEIPADIVAIAGSSKFSIIGIFRGILDLESSVHFDAWSS